MRKILITLLILVAFIVTMSIFCIFGGRQLSLSLDRFGTLESAAVPIQSLTYEGGGTGGIFHLNDLRLSLAPSDSHSPQPHIGTTKDDQLALSYGGKVFPFGPVRLGTEMLATDLPADDDASISIRHSALSWPTLFDTNFMTGQPPSWKRYLYYRLAWKKTTGAKLEMLWRYEQYFYPHNGWNNGMMTREGVTGLVEVAIRP
jgi:hypothetical protein